jgi:hypothetical protein
VSMLEHIKGKVRFVRYRRGQLIYRTDSGLEFPVPTDDCGDASFEAEEKAILFMRWIKRHLEEMK